MRNVAVAPWRPHVLRWLAAAVILLPTSASHAQQTVVSPGLPRDVPAQIRSVWTQVRKAWKPDTQFAGLTLERDTAKSEFHADYAFRSNADARLYHVRQGPGGQTGGLDARPQYAPGLTSRVIDLGAAEAVARKHGMKGYLVTAKLEYWVDRRSTNGVAEAPSTVGIEVWRLVPDNDPNTSDPNDPNMKNYLVDALNGTYYDPAHIDPAAFTRNAQASGYAAFQELSEIIRSYHP